MSYGLEVWNENGVQTLRVDSSMLLAKGTFDFTVSLGRGASTSRTLSGAGASGLILLRYTAIYGLDELTISTSGTTITITNNDQLYSATVRVIGVLI